MSDLLPLVVVGCLLARGGGLTGCGCGCGSAAGFRCSGGFECTAGFRCRGGGWQQGWQQGCGCGDGRSCGCYYRPHRCELPWVGCGSCGGWW